jgi:hypothetical protein
MTIALNDLTQGTLAGTGVFDKLMAATKAHISAEFTAGRIKGPEYATVYLGALDSAMAQAAQFLLAKDKVAADILLVQAETNKTTASTLLVDAQKADVVQQTANLVIQGTLLTQQRLQSIEETALTVQKTANAVLEGLVLTATKCKLEAEFDLIVNNVAKVTSEISLLNQKLLTEKAQVSNAGVAAESVLGRQNALYSAQSDGFKRNAEHKVADLMISTWNTRRMTSDATLADYARLTDADIALAVGKMFSGIGLS